MVIVTKMDSLEKRFQNLSLFDRYCVVKITKYPLLYRTRLEVMESLFVDDYSEDMMEDIDGVGTNYFKLRYLSEKEFFLRVTTQINSTHNNVGAYHDVLRLVEQKPFRDKVRDNAISLVSGNLEDAGNKLKNLGLLFSFEERDGYEKSRMNTVARLKERLVSDDILLFSSFVNLEESFRRAREEYFQYLLSKEEYQDIRERLIERNDR